MGRKYAWRFEIFKEEITNSRVVARQTRNPDFENELDYDVLERYYWYTSKTIQYRKITRAAFRTETLKKQIAELRERTSDSPRYLDRSRANQQKLSSTSRLAWYACRESKEWKDLKSELAKLWSAGTKIRCRTRAWFLLKRKTFQFSAQRTEILPMSQWGNSRNQDTRTYA